MLLTILDSNDSPYFTMLLKVLEGLKTGTSCSGIIIVVFLEILRAVFGALFLRIKLPKPRRYTLLPLANESLTTPIKASRLVNTVDLSIPVFWEISVTISAFVIFEILLFKRCILISVCKDTFFWLSKNGFSIFFLE